MTRAEAEKHKEIIKAFINGAEIEYYNKSNNEWLKANSPLFDVDIEYRVKPKEEIIPMDFSDAERLVGKTIRVRKNSVILLITSCEYKDVFAGGYMYSYKDLLNYCEFLDGSPIGKLAK